MSSVENYKKINEKGPVKLYYDITEQVPEQKFLVLCIDDDYSEYVNSVRTAVKRMNTHFAAHAPYTLKHPYPYGSESSQTNATDADLTYAQHNAPGGAYPEPATHEAPEKEPDKEPEKEPEKFGGWEQKVTEKVLKESGREEYIEQANKNHYAELPQFEGKESNDGFWCYNCEYFEQKQDSPTGYWCRAINIPDKPHGCCALHDLKPELRHEEGEVKGQNISKGPEQQKPQPQVDTSKPLDLETQRSRERIGLTRPPREGPTAPINDRSPFPDTVSPQSVTYRRPGVEEKKK